jgi:putative ABC transport system permease protein
MAVTSLDPGIEPDDVWVVALTTPTMEVENDAGADLLRRRMGAVLAAIEDVPGVTSATWGIEMPFENVGGSTCCWAGRTATMDVVDPTGEGSVLTYYHPVSDHFFETLGTRLLVGTSWTTVEATSSPLPVVLSESLAIAHFGSSQAATGRDLQMLTGFGTMPLRVIGVAEPTLHYGLDQTHPDAMYLPIEALPFGNDAASFAVKAPGVGPDIVDALRRAIWSAEPDVPIPSVAPLQTWIDESSGVRRLSSTLSSAFGAMALLLAAGGLYGTLLYAASQRRRELGIRIALGARRGRIQGEVVAGGVGLSAVGVVLGVPAAIYLGRLLESFLWNVSPTDPTSVVGAAAVLLATAAIACWLPAYRASRTDPLEVLRAE